MIPCKTLIQFCNGRRLLRSILVRIITFNMCIYTYLFIYFSVGHKGKFGHEFLEFEFRADGKLRYANDSQYRKDPLIRKEVTVNRIVLEELLKIIKDCESMQ